MTHPEIRDFFDRYVWDSQHLPIKEYYAKLGITLIEDAQGQPVRFEIDPNPTDEQRAAARGLAGPEAARRDLSGRRGSGVVAAEVVRHAVEVGEEPALVHAHQVELIADAPGLLAPG